MIKRHEDELSAEIFDVPIDDLTGSEGSSCNRTRVSPVSKAGQNIDGGDEVPCHL